MSRAYRLSVKESERRILKGSDHISTHLEILGILPKETMAGLLAEELMSRGYVEQNGTLVQQAGDITIVIDPNSAEVKVTSVIQSEEELEVNKDGNYFDETPEKQRRQLKVQLTEAAKKSLNEKAQQREKQLSVEATEKLEQAIRDLQGEMNSVVNRVTASALKKKAAQLGQIKEMTEDTETGSLTIVLEV